MPRAIIPACQAPNRLVSLVAASSHERTAPSRKKRVIIEPTRCTVAGTPAALAPSRRPSSRAWPSDSSLA